MNLSPADAELFYKLTWPLQFYANQQLQILPHIDSLELYQESSQQDKSEVRNGLYENPELIDNFVAQNLANLSTEELAIIKSWKKCVAGSFYIERFLKKGTIFIGPPSDSVYLVLGLQDSLEDIFYGRKPPIWVNSVLLPFKGRIIYDGMLGIYNMFFGKGIRTNLKKTYMAAKQNGRILETLEPDSQPSQQISHKPASTWQPSVDQIADMSNKLRGNRNEPIRSRAFGLLKASANLTQTAVNDPDNLDEIRKLAQKIERALNQLETVLYRADM